MQAQRGFGAGEIHPLTFAGALPMDQRHEDRHCHVVGAGVVHERVAPTGRFVVREAVGEREPGNCLHDRTPGFEVAVGSHVAETTVRDIDDVRLDRLELVVAEAPALQDALGEVFADDVRNADQLPQEFFAALGAQVQRDAIFVGVVIVEATAEIDASTFVDEWWDAAQDVPAPLADRVFDADDLGTERGEPFGRPGARQLAGEVTDAKRRQCLGHGVRKSPSGRDAATCRFQCRAALLGIE